MLGLEWKLSSSDPYNNSLIWGVFLEKICQQHSISLKSNLSLESKGITKERCKERRQREEGKVVAEGRSGK